MLASPVASPILTGAGAGLLRNTLGFQPPQLLATLELVTHVPPLFDFPPGRFVPDRGQMHVLVSFGNSNSLSTWQGIRHQSTAARFAGLMNRAGRGQWMVYKNYAHEGDTELEVDAQVTNRRTVRELRGVENLAVFVDPCGDDFKHNLATPAQVDSLRRFLYTLNHGGLSWPGKDDRTPQDLLDWFQDKRRVLSSIEREAAYVAGSVARDIAGIGENTYRLLDDIRRLYHPAYIFWINAANYGYARFFSLGEAIDKHFPINAPIERIFATNVAAAVNNQEYLGIKKFLSHEQGGTALVYVDAYRHISPAELADGPHYNDAGVERLAELAAAQFV